MDGSINLRVYVSSKKVGAAFKFINISTLCVCIT